MTGSDLLFRTAGGGGQLPLCSLEGGVPLNLILQRRDVFAQMFHNLVLHSFRQGFQHSGYG